jgi:hypothetical protein
MCLCADSPLLRPWLKNVFMFCLPFSSLYIKIPTPFSPKVVVEGKPKDDDCPSAK